MHQWRGYYGKQVDVEHYYHRWLFGHRTLSEIADDLGISIKTLRDKFDAIDVAEGLLHAPDKKAINLQIDATYFGNDYGFICFHDSRRVIYFHEIAVETSQDILQGLSVLKAAGYRFKSVTIDGRKGFAEAIRKVCGPVPIQLCLFHARAIVRRYLGPNPATDAAKDLAKLMSNVRAIYPQNFIDQFTHLQNKHHEILRHPHPLLKRSRNRQRIRLAYRFVQNNMHRFFTFREFPESHIPTTTNHLEGLFSHLKERINLHRGLNQNNKKKAIKFLLKYF